MSLEEINDLDSHDYQNAMRERVLSKREEVPETPDGDYDYLEWIRTHVSEEEMEAEFLVFKDELRAVENERLRVDDLKNRLHDLKDMRLAFHTVHPDKPNPKLFFKKLLKHSDHEYVEDVVAELEAKDTELFETEKPKKEKKEKLKKREDDILEAGYSLKYIVEALYRHTANEDSTMLDAMKDKMNEIDENNPIG